jgi:hypothetical protein
MYPFGDLPQNLAAFCGTLRAARGFTLGPGEIGDAARALEVVDLTDERRVRHALRSVLSSSRDTAKAFDVAFEEFFFPGPPGAPQPGLPRLPRDGPADTRGPERRGRPSTPDPDDDAEPPEGDAATDAAPDPDESSAEAERPVRLARAIYSPLTAEGRARLVFPAGDPAWLAAARAFVRRLELGLSRRWRAGRRGRRFDLRRTWRASLQTGGEALSPRWLQRARRRPRVVLVIDGSRSMSTADPAALAMAVALAGATRRLEAFVFSTALYRVTSPVRDAAAGRGPAAIDLDRGAWGGGTDIGASLHAFLTSHGERHLGRDTVVVIVSDGLDVGDPVVLRDAVQTLRRRSAGVVWLNPLLDTPGYKPTARGMAAARPFVTSLASVQNPQGLRQLARQLRLRA